MLFDGGWDENAASSSATRSNGESSRKRKRPKSTSGPDAVPTAAVTRTLDKIDRQLANVSPRKKHKANSKKESTLPAAAPAEHPAKQPLSTVPRLTSLQANMKQKLDGAQFRYINEVLYKTDSTEASKMMQDDPGMFDKYHSGFRRQVESWPTNPVDIFIKELATLPAGSVIADLGCGEAAIAQNMTPRGYCVLSYDLVSTSPFVVAADTCSHIPLPGREESSDGTVVDVCVCALSLMNSNWLSCVREVRRVLKNTGKFKVAEVTSRFKDVDKFVELVEKVGFKLLSKRTPSTHFTLFEFRRLPDRPVSEKAWAELTAQQSILQPCEYKRR